MPIAQRHHQGLLTFQATNQYSNVSKTTLSAKKNCLQSRKSLELKPRKTERWWKNLLDSILPDTEWRKHLSMDREAFMKIASDL